MSATTRKTGLDQVVRALLIRLFVLVVLVFIALGGILTARAITTQDKLQAEKFDAVGLAATPFLAHESSLYLFTEDFEELEKQLKKVKHDTSDSRYVAVVTDAGKVTASDPPGFTLPAEAPLRADEPSAFDLQFKGSSIRHFVAPVKGDSKTQYFVHLGLDQTRSLEERSATSAQAVIWTLVLTVVALLLVGYGSRSIMRQTTLAANTLESTVDMITTTAQELKASAAEILAVSKSTESNAADEAAAVDETRRTMHALLESSNEITLSASAVLESAQRSASASTTVAERISTLSTQALKITDVSDAIRAIADKSDILALNASLEGAKAGEAGRGFVLVGAEMRRLAETVMDEVHQIKQLASEIGELSQSAVLATEEGEKLSKATAETARHITLITQQQRTGTEQVSHSMDEVQQFTKQALSGAKQVKTTADDLARTAQELSRLVERVQRGGASAKA